MKASLKILNLLENILDFFALRKCLVCRRKKASPVNSYVCEYCEASLKIYFGESIKRHELGSKPIFFTSFYKDGAKKLIKDLKYRRPRLAKFWGDFMAKYWLRYSDQISRISSLKDPEIFITEIPLNKKREKERGYNQSALVAEYFQRSLKKNFKTAQHLPQLLERIKDTEALYEKNKIERIEILKDAFKIRSEAEIKTDKEKVLIVIDDISTTGCTLMEAEKTLKQANTFNEIVLMACTANH